MLDLLRPGRLAGLETPEGDFGKSGEPFQPLQGGARLAAILELMYQRTLGAEGLTPQLFVREIDLTAAAGATERATIQSDFRPDRWIIWMRAVASATIRVALGDWVSPTEAIEVGQGQRLVLGIPHNPEGQPVDKIAFLSTGAGAPHVFAVAVAGGTEFDIGSIV